MPFNTDIVNDVLAKNVGNYIGLLYNVVETSKGTLASWTEPPIDTTLDKSKGGYERGYIKEWNDKIDRQVANAYLILAFEARSALVGTAFTHFGLFSTGDEKYQYSKDYPLRFYGELTEPLTISNEGYVPLIRACELIIGMDTTIKTNYADYE